jgi:hypothetical protein
MTLTIATRSLGRWTSPLRGSRTTVLRVAVVMTVLLTLVLSVGHSSTEARKMTAHFCAVDKRKSVMFLNRYQQVFLSDLSSIPQIRGRIGTGSENEVRWSML